MVPNRTRRRRAPLPAATPRASRRLPGLRFGLGFASGVVATLVLSPGESAEQTAAPLDGTVAETAAEAPVEPVTYATYGPALELAYPEMGPPIEGNGPRALAGRIAKNERVADVLSRAGATVLEIERALAALAGKVDFRRTRTGDRYDIRIAPGGKVERFLYARSPLEQWVVELVDGAYVGRKIEVEVEREVVLVEGEVRSSLYEAFIEAGEKPALAMELAHVYRFDFDFNTETRKGDRFRLYVERDVAEGKTVGYGKIFAAEYRGKRLFELEGEYYDAKGRAARKAFLKSPLSFTRVSSAYGYRTHPITKRRHFHGGVDYAAPTGTRVQAVADGVVTFAARKGPNGKMVKIRHSGGFESYYLHLSRIGVKRGQRVKQSTVIGRVGSTGRSTGPHLDFRLKQNGKYTNPTKRVVARNIKVPRKKRGAFSKLVSRWNGRFDAEMLSLR